MAKIQWKIHREVVPKLDGQQRWDKAYQALLQVSIDSKVDLVEPKLLDQISEPEVIYESSNLCQGIYSTSGSIPQR